MKFYVYHTINIINGKEYYGVHQSWNIENDDYVGSGVAIARAIKKYGRENFIRTIVAVFDSRKEAESIEAEIVTPEFVKLNSNYNLAPGGRGGVGKMYVPFEERSRRWKLAVKRITPEQRKLSGIKSGNTQRGRTKETHAYLVMTAEKNKINSHLWAHKISLKNKLLWINERDKMMKAVAKAAAKNRGKTKENCEGKRRQAEKISGENNPMKRDDVLEKFIGKTKENCEWRARQAATLKETQSGFDAEKKAEIAKKLSEKLSGAKNPMYGKRGEKSPSSKYSNDQRLHVIKLFDENIPRKQISLITGVEYQTVKVLIRNRDKVLKEINKITN